MVTILLAGAILGLAHNYIALEQGIENAVPWVPEKLLDLSELPTSAGDGSVDPYAPTQGAAAYGEPDDPLAIPAASASGASDVPFVPDLDRPIQIQLDAVKKFFDADAALIVDARDDFEYEEGHIPGALLMPYDRVVTDPEALEKVDSGGRPIITYCSGGTCDVSLNLAWSLLQAGQKRVLVFMGGWPAWEEAGYPVARGLESEPRR